MHDIHTHILPYMDDGATDIKDSENMIEMESEMRVRKISLTPHFYPDSESLPSFLKRRECALKKCRDWSLLSYKELSFASGSETLLSQALFIYENIDALCYEGTTYLLLELPYEHKWNGKVYRNIERLIDYYRINPIIAHIERYMPVRKNLRVVKELKSIGCEFQVNAASLFEKHNQKMLDRMFEYGYIDYIASDCHNTDMRPPCLLRGYEYIKKRYGDSAAATLYNNAGHI